MLLAVLVVTDNEFQIVGNLVLLQQLNNFENPLRIDKVIATSLMYYILGHSVECGSTKLTYCESH